MHNINLKKCIIADSSVWKHYNSVPTPEEVGQRGELILVA